MSEPQRTFRLLKLTHIPFNKVLQMMDTLSVIKLTQTSKKAKRRTENYRPSRFAVEFTDYDAGCHILFGNFVWTFFHPTHYAEQNFPEDASFQMESIGEISEVVYAANENEWKSTSLDIHLSLNRLINFLLKLFNASRITEIEVNIDCGKFMKSIFETLNTSKVDHLYLSAITEITPGNLTLFLDKVREVNYLEFGFEVEPIPYPKGFTGSCVTIWPADFFQLTNLLESNVEQLELLNCNLSSKDMNTFLKRWINGESHICQFLRILKTKHCWNRNEILDGIQSDDVDVNSADQLRKILRTSIENVVGKQVTSVTGETASVWMDDETHTHISNFYFLNTKYHC